VCSSEPAIAAAADNRAGFRAAQMGPSAMYNTTQQQLLLTSTLCCATALAAPPPRRSARPNRRCCCADGPRAPAPAGLRLHLPLVVLGVVVVGLWCGATCRASPPVASAATRSSGRRRAAAAGRVEAAAAAEEEEELQRPLSVSALLRTILSGFKQPKPAAL